MNKAFQSLPHSDLPSHIAEGNLDMPDARLVVSGGRGPNTNQRQHGVGNAQSIAADDAVALAQPASDYVHLPDMFCKKK